MDNNEIVAAKLAITVFVLIVPIMLPSIIAHTRRHRWTLVITVMSIFAFVGLTLDQVWLGIPFDALDLIVWVIAFFLAFTPSGRRPALRTRSDPA
jgi:hypothetical protein